MPAKPSEAVRIRAAATGAAAATAALLTLRNRPERSGTDSSAATADAAVMAEAARLRDVAKACLTWGQYKSTGTSSSSSSTSASSAAGSGDACVAEVSVTYTLPRHANLATSCVTLDIRLLSCITCSL
jgi:hypothetical protein